LEISAYSAVSDRVGPAISTTARFLLRDREFFSACQGTFWVEQAIEKLKLVSRHCSTLDRHRNEVLEADGSGGGA
jgi:hypothetical protein